MTDTRNSWAEIIQAVGDAVVGELKAEIAALSEHWKWWGGRAAVAAGLFAISAVVLFSAILFLPYFLTATIKHLSGWSWMAASGLVLLIVLLIGGILGAVGYWRFKSLDDPIAMTRERVDDHMIWQKSKLFGSVDESPGAAVLKETQQTQGGGDGGS